MNNGGIIGKIVYFWIFMIGALLFARYVGHVQDGKQMIFVCVAVAIVYIVFQVFRALGKNKREEKAEKRREANRTPVHKGQSNKKKKKR